MYFWTLLDSNKALAEYLEGKISANKNTPLSLKNFVVERKSVLLKFQERPELADVIKKLMVFEEFEEREDYTITVDGAKYAPFQKGSFITFGKYPHGANDEIAPIEWQVLDVSADDALLISRYGLDRTFYDMRKDMRKWEESILRKWLNEDFLNKAFSPDEVDKIKVSELVNYGGKNTHDRVFCLSYEEAVQYLAHEDQPFQSTDYAQKRVGEGISISHFQLRSSTQEKVNPMDLTVFYGQSAVVRPALRIVL